MNISKTNLTNLAQHISTAAVSLGSALALMGELLPGLAQAAETAPAPNAEASVKAPSSTAQATARETRKPTPVIDPGLGTVTQTVGKDGRAHLPKALFEGLPSILVNGKEFKPFTSGRGKATAEELGAKVGDLVTFYRQAPGRWVTTVATGETAQAQAPAKETAAATPPPPAQAQAAPTMESFFGTVQAQTSANATAGVVNTNYPEGDPRRHMTREQRKAFNRTVSAEARKAGAAQPTTQTLAEMAQMVGQRVYNVPANA